MNSFNLMASSKKIMRIIFLNLKFNYSFFVSVRSKIVRTHDFIKINCGISGIVIHQYWIIKRWIWQTMRRCLLAKIFWWFVLLLHNMNDYKWGFTLMHGIYNGLLITISELSFTYLNQFSWMEKVIWKITLC